MIPTSFSFLVLLVILSLSIDFAQVKLAVVGLLPVPVFAQLVQGTMDPRGSRHCLSPLPRGAPGRLQDQNGVLDRLANFVPRIEDAIVGVLQPFELHNWPALYCQGRQSFLRFSSGQLQRVHLVHCEGELRRLFQ